MRLKFFYFDILLTVPTGGNHSSPRSAALEVPSSCTHYLTFKVDKDCGIKYWLNICKVLHSAPMQKTSLHYKYFVCF